MSSLRYLVRALQSDMSGEISPLLTLHWAYCMHQLGALGTLGTMGGLNIQGFKSTELGEQTLIDIQISKVLFFCGRNSLVCLFLDLDGAISILKYL